MTQSGRDTAFLETVQSEVQCAYWQTCRTQRKVGHEATSEKKQLLNSWSLPRKVNTLEDWQNVWRRILVKYLCPGKHDLRKKEKEDKKKKPGILFLHYCGQKKDTKYFRFSDLTLALDFYGMFIHNIWKELDKQLSSVSAGLCVGWVQMDSQWPGSQQRQPHRCAQACLDLRD